MQYPRSGLDDGLRCWLLPPAVHGVFEPARYRIDLRTRTVQFQDADPGVVTDDLALGP